MKVKLGIKVMKLVESLIGWEVTVGTNSQPFLYNLSMDPYKTWWGGSTHGHANAFRLFDQIRPEVDPGGAKIRSMRAPSPYDFFFRSECNRKKLNA